MSIKNFIKENVPDSLVLKYQFKRIMGYPLDLKNPKTFNEKIQWLKLHDRNPLYTKMVDKYEAKNLVANIIGEEYIIPTLGVWNHFDEIDFDALPTNFVLKTTHDSGGVVIVKDKNNMNRDSARKKIESSLKRNFYYWGREWPYKNVKPRIIAEKYMSDDPNDGCSKELKDYKFFCFGGQAKCFKVDFDRFIDHHANYYDPNGNLLNFGEQICPPDFNRKLDIDKPTLSKMKDLASALSKEIPFLRTDFYSVDEKIYFGELTFYPASGFGKFTNEEADKLLGNWIQIWEGYIIVLNNIIAILNNTKLQAKSLMDFKIQCFNGIADNIMVCTDRTDGGPFFYYFDRKWNYLPYSKQVDTNFNEPEVLKPHNLDEMIAISEKLSKDIPELRVDLYEVNNKIYFGELTFFTSSGFDLTITKDADALLGNKLKLDMT